MLAATAGTFKAQVLSWEGKMKLILGMISLSSVVACAHWSAPAPVSAAQGAQPQHFYKFETVTLPKQRTVSSEKKNKNVKEEEKFVTVYKCDSEVNCVPTEANKKTVPYNEFAAQLKDKAMRKGVDVVDKQQRLLADGLQKLKQERANVSSENAYYKHQLEFYRFASLRPVVANFKKAHQATESELKAYSAKIEKYEKDLEYLKGVKGVRLGMDTSTEKLMELVEVGQLKFGDGQGQDVVWEFLQQVGYDLAKN